MRNSAELVEAARAAVEDDDYTEAAEIVCEALGHLSDFSWKTGEEWERNDVRSCCNEIGDIIYDKGGLQAMQDVYYDVRYEMKGVAARYLEHFWDGCGDGAWRG